jgi:hypothetical protein
MSQCLRCNKPCVATAVFCDECKLLLNYRLQQGAVTAASFEALPLATTPSEYEENGVRISGNPLERTISSYTTINNPQTPLPAEQALYASNGRQAVNRFNAAVHSIEEVEQPVRRTPRAPRLAPIYDVSADIQRESTLRPAVSKKHGNNLAEGSRRRRSDDWPWLQNIDDEETDIWANRTDPLARRHIPTRAEVERLEKEYMRRINTRRLGPLVLPYFKPHSIRMPVILSIVAVAALLAMTVNILLISVVFVQPHPQAPIPAALPTLTISPNKASIGQTVQLYLSGFLPSAHVLLTHDIEEALQTGAASSLVQVSPTGAADVSILIDDNWGPGFHTIGAEDVTTRYTASTTLQIINSGPTRPSHLLLDNTFLNMGTDVQGANTLQSLVLRNSGGNAISWTASSNEPWLMVSPSAGMFSTSQVISVAVERKNLKVGDYKGGLTISSNVGAPEHVAVEMTVRALPATAGPVLVVSPAVLSFVATDGGPDPSSQLLTLSNPGSQPLDWSLSSNTMNGSGSFFPTPDSMKNWLSADHVAGVVASGSIGSIKITVHSEYLLPGTYAGTLVFTARQGALDNPQEVSVTLTLLPHCGLTTSAGNLSFTTVSGQVNPANQTLGLSATASCAGTISWHATYKAHWLKITPASGQLKGVASAVTTVGVNTENLKPGTYSSIIAFSAGQSTQVVIVQLIVQHPPTPNAPLLSIASSGLNFSSVQGQTDPPGQAVTITNNGGGPLYWHTNVNILASSWLGAAPSGGVITAGRTGQITVNIDPSQLTPGTYVGQIVLIGSDAHGVAAAGSPQTITVNLLVQPPCTLAQPSSGNVTFNAVLGNPDPDRQSVSIAATGSCDWPLSVHTSVSSAASWLNLALSSDSITASGQSVTVQIAPALAGLEPGTYTAQVSVTATNSSDEQAQGSPQTFSVALIVSHPCVLQVSSTPSPLPFTVAQAQAAPPAQNVSFSETGDCARPISWKATGDASSSSWLVLSSTSGTDNGSSTVSVSVNPTGLEPGTYSGQITLSANDSDGNVLHSSPQTITVTLTVTGN